MCVVPGAWPRNKRGGGDNDDSTAGSRGQHPRAAAAALRGVGTWQQRLHVWYEGGERSLLGTPRATHRAGSGGNLEEMLVVVACRLGRERRVLAAGAGLGCVQLEEEYSGWGVAGGVCADLSCRGALLARVRAVDCIIVSVSTSVLAVHDLMHRCFTAFQCSWAAAWEVHLLHNFGRQWSSCRMTSMVATM
jgi:hypothetical protein